jgi:hypothetical protein
MDKAEAIKRIKDHIMVHHIGEYPHIKIAEALSMAITALATDNNVGSKWIPVTERLPEKRGFVLVFTYDKIAGEAFMEGDGRFYWSNTDEYAEPLFITHWMPLPEPPKED